MVPGLGAPAPQADRRLEPRPGRLRAATRTARVVARRGGGGLVTALRSLVAHHDVTWIASAMTEDDRVVADRGTAGEAFEEPARDGSPYRLRLVGITTPAPTTGSTTSSRTRCCGSCSTTSGADALAGRRSRPAQRVAERLRPGEPDFADAVLAELEREPDAAVFFHDYHLYLAPRIVREQRAGRDARRTSSISRGRNPTTGTCSPSRSAARSTRGSSPTTSSGSTRRAGGGTSCAAARTSWARPWTSR